VRRGPGGGRPFGAGGRSSAPAARGLARAFLAAGSAGAGAVIAPRVRPLGDVDEDDLSWCEAAAGLEREASDLVSRPSIDPARRRFILTRLAARCAEASGAPFAAPAALAMGDEMAGLLDSLYTEEVDVTRLERAAPPDLAAHWARSLTFLKILTSAWPAILSEAGLSDPAARRGALLARLADAWEAAPPAGPVVAAGSTGSAPAVARLLARIARLPLGCVVLPGLDLEMDEVGWAQIDDPHPQMGLKRLLAVLGVTRADVALWPGARTPDAPRAARARLLSAALRPAPATDDWLALSQQLERADPGLRLAAWGLRRVHARDETEEAAAAAILLRESLEQPGRRAVLVTPDRGLARRVAANLRRWGIAADDSGGLALGETPVGVFLQLVADLAADPGAAAPLLALLRHPLTRAGLSLEAVQAAAQTLDLHGLRGVRLRPGFDDIRRRLAAARGLSDPDRAGALELLARIETALAAMMGWAPDEPVALHVAADAHLRAAEALGAADEDDGAGRLWAGDAGAAAAEALEAAIRADDADWRMPAASYPAVFARLIAPARVRARAAGDAPVAILGPLEARLQHADRIVLSGLNEGVWPSDAPLDPWLSRPMRAAVGLPSPERRLGQAAHDFAQMAAAPDVALTCAARRGGQPASPSRWLLRLETLLSDDARRASDWTERLAGWAASLDAAEGPVRPVPPPAPRPPVAARPRRLSVSRVEAWVRDPYAVYAREVLRLRKLDPWDEAPGAAARGSALHEIVAAWTRHGAATRGEAAMLDIAARVLEACAPPVAVALWRPRLAAMARWFTAFETERLARGLRAEVEIDGALTIERPGGPFVLTARADRIDFGPDGTCEILDYKTGDAPSGPQVKAGFNPQLPLEALIAAAGGFDGAPPARARALAYAKIGQAAGGKCKEPVGTDEVADLIEQTRSEFARLIDAFDRPDTPYLSQPRAKYQNVFGDYDHLARRKEWSAVETDE